jgi:hypothetical protein
MARTSSGGFAAPVAPLADWTVEGVTGVSLPFKFDGLLSRIPYVVRVYLILMMAHAALMVYTVATFKCIS